MEAIIDQTLCDVFYLNTDRLEGACIEDELVSACSLLALVKDRVVLLETGLDVVRVQDRHLRCIGQSLCAHHCDVRVRDQENACRSPWCCRDRTDRLTAIDIYDRMSRQERG